MKLDFIKLYKWFSYAWNLVYETWREDGNEGFWLLYGRT